jgi:TRAP-type C4-dicarboxylate transport system permease small subunit
MVWSKVLASGTQTTSDLRLPLVWFTSIAAAGAVAAALLALARVVELVRGRRADSDAAEAGDGA